MSRAADKQASPPQQGFARAIFSNSISVLIARIITIQASEVSILEDSRPSPSAFRLILPPDRWSCREGHLPGGSDLPVGSGKDRGVSPQPRRPQPPALG